MRYKNFSCTPLCVSSNFCPKIHNLECPDRSYQFIETIESIIPSGITFSTIVDIVDSCKHKGYYSFGPFSDRFIGIMTIVPMDNIEQSNKSQIRICKCD